MSAYWGRPEVIGARSKRRDCHTVAALRFFSLRRSDVIEHTTFVHESRKLRPGHESNMLSPRLGDLPVGRLVEWGVQPYSKKYFGFHTPQITSRTFRIPSHTEGRIMIVTNVGRDAVDAAAFCARWDRRAGS